MSQQDRWAWEAGEQYQDEWCPECERDVQPDDCRCPECGAETIPEYDLEDFFYNG